MHVRLLGQNLQADRSRPRHDCGRIVRLDDDIAVLAGDVSRHFGTRIAVWATKHQLRAPSFRRFHLETRRRIGHHHCRADAENLCGIGNGLGMVAARMRHDTPPTLFFAKGKKSVESAPDLECADRMQAFSLE